MTHHHEHTQNAYPRFPFPAWVCVLSDGRTVALSLCLNEDFLSFSFRGVFPEKGLPSPGGRTSCYREPPGTHTHTHTFTDPRQHMENASMSWCQTLFDLCSPSDFSLLTSLHWRKCWFISFQNKSSLALSSNKLYTTHAWTFSLVKCKSITYTLQCTLDTQDLQSDRKEQNQKAEQDSTSIFLG